MYIYDKHMVRIESWFCSGNEAITNSEEIEIPISITTEEELKEYLRKVRIEFR